MLARHQEPILAIATAPGRGAVGIVRLSGKGLAGFSRALCGRELTPRHASYLPLQDAQGDVIDHGIVLYFIGPQSYTGEDVLELQVHGGQVVLQLLLARCLALAAERDEHTGHAILAGLRLAQPGEFTERAFLNGKLDLAQAEAVADLIDASTEVAARSASRSLGGAFSKEISDLRERLIHLRMLVEATLDFPEEEIDFLQKADAQGQLLREGIKVVIAGQPNAGKSSLLNALAGAELAIVTPIPGTTRDKVQQTIQIEGVPLHVIDTAGLRESHDEVERIGIARAWAEIEQADAVLFLHDLTRASQADYQQADSEIAQQLTQRISAQVVVLDVWNKQDAASAAGQAGIALSAQTGAGLETLRKKLLEIVGWQAAPEGVYMARERHVQALQRVRAHLQQAQAYLAAQAQMLDLLAEELRLAQNALNEITGEFTADDLLGVIFSSFCIGK